MDGQTHRHRRTDRQTDTLHKYLLPMNQTALILEKLRAQQRTPLQLTHLSVRWSLSMRPERCMRLRAGQVPSVITRPKPAAPSSLPILHHTHACVKRCCQHAACMQLTCPICKPKCPCCCKDPELPMYCRYRVRVLGAGCCGVGATQK